ncbi:MAG: hypothetical protein HGB05_06575 [Chloroflexi bacterium]|nr:hypothetical protein [Chloroflexota bacterium]
MATQTSTTKQVLNVYEDTLAQVNAAQAPLLDRFAAAQSRRAASLTTAATQLQQALGENDPQVISVQRAALAANRFKVVVAERSAQEAWRPNIGRLEWMTYGRVLDESGKPAGGLHVRVFDRDRKYDDLLGDTVTDVQGRFAVTYHQRDFAEVRENLPELYVLVEDEAGQVLYSSRDAVRFRAGRAEYFEIQLGQAPAPEKPKTPPTRSKQTRAKKA